MGMWRCDYDGFINELSAGYLPQSIPEMRRGGLGGKKLEKSIMSLIVVSSLQITR
jgi:hypothetical protein